MKIIATILLMFCIFKTSAQVLTHSEKVDSFFVNNFDSIKNYLKNRERVLSSNNLDFVNLITQLSGISPTIQYGIAVNSKQYKEWKIWYKCYKNKINWQIHIVEGMKLIKTGMPNEEREKEVYIEKLSKLKIQ